MPRGRQRCSPFWAKHNRVFDYGFCGEGDVDRSELRVRSASRTLWIGAALSVAGFVPMCVHTAVHSSLTDHGAMMATVAAATYCPQDEPGRQREGPKAQVFAERPESRRDLSTDANRLRGLSGRSANTWALAFTCRTGHPGGNIRAAHVAIIAP